MTPLPIAAFLGARIDGVDPSSLVAGAYLIAAALLFCGLVFRTIPAGNRASMAGIMLATGAALYSHDVINLPEMISIMAMGGGIGLLFARRCPAWAFPWVVVAGHGLTGVAIMATAAALCRNPLAFGLAGDDGAMAAGNVAMLILCCVLAGAATIHALAMAFRRTQAALPMLSATLAFAAAALGLAMGNSVMVMAGGMAGVAACRIGWRGRRIGRAV